MFRSKSMRRVAALTTFGIGIAAALCAAPARAYAASLDAQFGSAPQSLDRAQTEAAGKVTQRRRGGHAVAA